MIFTLLIQNTTHTPTALNFCQELLAQAQNINCIFFYREGVLELLKPHWQKFAKDQSVKIYACPNSVSKYLSDAEITIEIAGLATFYAHSLEASRVITL